MPLLISHTRLTPTSEVSPITRVTVSKAPEPRLRLPRCAPAPPSMHACASFDARLLPPRCAAAPPSMHACASFDARLLPPRCAAAPSSMRACASFDARLRLPRCAPAPSSMLNELDHKALLDKIGGINKPCLGKCIQMSINRQSCRIHHSSWRSQRHGREACRLSDAVLCFGYQGTPKVTT